MLSLTYGQTQRLIVCDAIAGLHLLFLFFCRYLVLSQTHCQKQRLIVCDAIAGLYLLFLFYCRYL